MYKSKLQELCQRQRWELPEYTTVKDGPDHTPRFTATVNVHGQVFETPAQCKSLKDAQNTAAQIAFDHFTAPPSPPQVHCPQQTTSTPPTVNHQFEGVSSEVPAGTVTPVVPRPEVEPFATAPLVVPRTEVHPVATAPTVVSRPEVQPPVVSQPEVQPPVVSQPEVQPPVVSPFEVQLPFVSRPEVQPPVVAAAPLLPLSPLPSSLPTPPPGLLATKTANTKPADSEALQHHIDTLHMYKNQLQQFAQKKGIGLPMYTTESEGPPHTRRFKSSVSLNGISYEKSEYFPTLKEAEQAAAKIACQVLSVDVIQEDGVLYKNLLQELAQKRGLLCPSYETVKSGMSHRPSFASTVELGGHTYRGAEARTKKQAEMNAAKAAYCALIESDPATEYASASSFAECDVADSVSQIVKKRQDETVEADVQPKRAKSSPENVNMNTHLPGPSEGNNPLSDDSAMNPRLVKEQPVEQQLPLCSKTVVHPRKSSLPKPEHAAVLPFSDDQWVAYKVEQGQEPTAQM